ncbi:hypothetical protein GCM10027418_16820 [Mariniluteicoccus endophyticus]
MQPLDIEDAIALLDSAPDDPRVRAMLKVEVLRAHMLRLWPRHGTWEGTQAIRGLYTDVKEAFGPDTPILEFVDVGEVVVDGRLDRVQRRLDRWEAAHGPGDPAGIELEAWAAMTLKKWPVERRRRTAERLEACPAFGPDHLYALILRDDRAALVDRFEDLPVSLRRDVAGARELRSRLAASLVADGRPEGGLAEYSMLAHLLAGDGMEHGEQAWAARVSALRIASDGEERRRMCARGCGRMLFTSRC